MRTRTATRLAAGALRGLAAAALAVAFMLILVASLVLLQAQRDETRAAGAAVVLSAELQRGTAATRQFRLDHALELYRSGTVSRLILTGAAADGAPQSEAAAGKAYLVERGVPAEAMLVAEQGDSTLERLRDAAEIARQGGIGTVLLVGDPGHMLRSLKIARDLQLAAYGSPAFRTPASRSFTSELGYAAREAWAYLVYIFLRQ